MNNLGRFLRAIPAFLLVALFMILAPARAQTGKGGDGGGTGRGTIGGGTGGGTIGGTGGGSGGGSIGTGTLGDSSGTGGGKIITPPGGGGIIKPVILPQIVKDELEKTGVLNDISTRQIPDLKLDLGKIPMQPVMSGKPFFYDKTGGKALSSMKKSSPSITGEMLNLSNTDLLPRVKQAPPEGEKRKGPVIMSVFTVSNLNDAGPGSLRQAILDANANPGADNINFAVTGTIFLTTGEMAITDQVTISGPGANLLTVSGSSLSRIMNVGGGVTAAISGLTFQDGNTNALGGAAIFSNSGSVIAIDACSFVGNVCTNAVNSGGAIHVFGSVTITNSTFTNNSHAQSGGALGINWGGSGTLTNCTFVNNTAAWNGGTGAAIANISFAGAATTLALTNCTVVGNPSGGLINWASSLTATISYKNTALSNPVANVQNYNAGGTAILTSLGYNISSDATGNLVGIGDQPNTNPLMGPLEINGGTLQTCAPLPGSPAIDKGGAVAAATDERGYPRVQDINAIPNAPGGNGTDIGAVEVKKWIVNVNNDLPDATPIGDGIADVDLITPGEQTSLRSALQETNAYADFDFIEFAIGAVGSIQTIMPTTWLPSISQPVYIDGWSQGGAGYLGSPLVEIDGGLTMDVIGLVIFASDCTVRGMAINNYPVTSFNGIGLGTFGGGAMRTWVYGNWFGLHPNGVTLKGSGQADIWLGNGSSQTLVGTNGDGVNDVAERNVIVDCKSRDGLLMDHSTNNVVAGNYVGIGPNGITNMGAALTGISLFDSPNNLIGGTTPARRNVISGNRFDGMYFWGAGSAGNTVQGNSIGTNAAGTASVGNVWAGVAFHGTSNNNLVRDNMISGNGREGIYVDINSSFITIKGNRIGTNDAGTVAISNGLEGVTLSDAQNNLIGGSTAADRNIISGNLAFGVLIRYPTATGNVVKGNYLGTNAAGTAAIGNTWENVYIYQGPGNIVGGAAAGEGNIIAGSLTGDGIEIATGASGNQVLGNFIGTNAAGTAAIPNAHSGIYLNLSPNCTIGGTTPGARNVLSGNTDAGISIQSDNTLVQGNFIGLNATGTGAVPNNLDGILTWGAIGTTMIGGVIPGAGNVISGNGQRGIDLTSTGPGNSVQGNFIGTNPAGTTSLPNGWDAIFIGNSHANLIGGTTPAARNYIYGTGYIVDLNGAAAAGNTVSGNYIGVTPAGNAVVGLSSFGVLLNFAGPGNIVGGPVPGAGNVIAGASLGIRNYATPGTLIKGNSIGLNAAGTAGLGSYAHGIWVDNGSSGVTIGGTTLPERNLLAGGNGAGIVFDGPATQGNTVQGNSIGTDISGSIALPFTVDGIHFQNSAGNTAIGGPAPGAGNRIWNNATVYGWGGMLINPGSINIPIRGNSFFNNNGLGITLYNGTFLPVPNDNCDGDAGANTLQNYPVLTSVIPGAGFVIINGTLNSTASQVFTLDFYSSPAGTQDPTGYGEGKTYLGSGTTATGPSCTGTFSVLLPFGGATCDVITATATNAAGNTSGFSKFMPADATPPTITFCPPNQNVEADASCNGQFVTYPPAQATDNCPYPLTITYSIPSGSYFPVGDTPVLVTVTDMSNNVATCSFNVHVEQRPIISTASSTVQIDFSCKLYPPYTKYLQINNIGGHFGGGQMAWSATTSAAEITLSPSSGLEGQNLGIIVDPSGLPFGTYTRTITITAFNNVSLSPACNSPYTVTVIINIEPALAGTQTKSVGTSFTQFTNSYGEVMAEIKSDNGTIPSFTVNWYPCTYPNGMYRWRYIKRYFTFSTSATSEIIDMRLYYTNEEMYGISHPDWLTIRQQPIPGGAWVDRGGVSDWLNNRVTTTNILNINGVFAMAHAWVPKVMNVTIVTATFDRTSRHSVIAWRSPIHADAEGFLVERTLDPAGPAWDAVGSVPFASGGEYGFSEKLAENGKYYYKIAAMDTDGEFYESEPFLIEAADAPVAYALEQNYPNPFNPSTAIAYQIADAGKVTLKVYDMYWREVAQLVNAEQAAGRYQVSFDASNLASGVYYYKLEAGSYTQIRKMNLMK